jgi:hypothetical protein
MTFWRELLTISATAFCLATSGDAKAWMAAKEFAVTTAVPETTFDLQVLGNHTTGIRGGFDAATNAFPGPKMTMAFDGSFTTYSFTGTSSLPPDPTTPRHFGVAGPEVNPPAVRAQYWPPTMDPSSGFITAASSLVVYPTGTGSATVTFRNEDPFEPLTIVSAGFQIVDRTSLRLDQLNATTMPPSSFTPLPLAVPLLLSANGTTAAMTISGPIDPSTQAVVLFYQTRCAMDNCISPGPMVNEWAASNDASPPVPLPAWVLLAIAAVVGAAGALTLAQRRGALTA